MLTSKIKVLQPIVCIFIVLVTQVYAGENISGTVQKGFRVLEMNPTDSPSQMTVYRGDYIKFQYPAELGPLDFTMPEMSYAGKTDPDVEKSAYYKMKKTGTFDFTLGQGFGSIKVIDLIRPNYLEVSAAEAAEIIENLDPFILDVRTQQEYLQINLPGATLIPIQQLQRRIGELELRKHEDIFIYCATGNRSTVAAKILADSGYKRIYNLRFGIFDWARQGYPYTTGRQ